MNKFKFLNKTRINQLPKTAGVYCFKKEKEILYIGKAANIKERVGQHAKLMGLAKRLGYIKSKTETGALLLEAKLIKKYRPRYNVSWKDDKNYFYVGVSKEVFPRIFITHQPQKIRNTKHEIRNKSQIRNSNVPNTLLDVWNLENWDLDIVSDFRFRISDFEYLGPFVDGKKLKQTLKDLRKSFPYRTCKTLPQKPCLWYHLAQCPAPCLFRAKRIEAYDISNIQGKTAAGSMVTFVKGKPDKNFYRRFKIHPVKSSEAGAKQFNRVKLSAKPDDLAMLKEVLSRRLKHTEWSYPDLILIDGGKAQLNLAASLTEIPVMAIAKKNNQLYMENLKKPVPLKNLPRETFNLILQLRDEAHRLALSYHRKLRRKKMFE